jgi:flavin reductase (DIM6/NTAB) family NADH-FMN oxidoreductase RutF
MNTKINTTWDKRDLRKALGSFGTGVTVVTSGNSQSRWVGVTANSFSSVSLEPPIVLWSLVSTSPNLEVFDQTERFVINVLGLEQVELSKQFSKSLTDKFAGVDCVEGLGGVPIIQNCVATFECKTVQRILVGDHVLFLGQVENYVYEGKTPLLFCQGQYVQVAEALQSN